jgi:nucleotide-binding universal stress UspA family protein
VAHEIEEAPILFAYDGSDYAQNAIQRTARELRPGRRAIVLTVWQLLGSFPAASLAIRLPDDLAGIVEEEAQKVADEGANLARRAGFEATPVVEEGDPVWQHIVDAAERFDASLIALGSHGRTGIGAVLLGSVAGAVARHTDRSVLIVHRPPADAAA